MHSCISIGYHPSVHWAIGPAIHRSVRLSVLHTQVEFQINRISEIKNAYNLKLYQVKDYLLREFKYAN